MPTGVAAVPGVTGHAWFVAKLMRVRNHPRVIRGENVTLRPIEPRDREPLKAIRDEPEVIRFWGEQTAEWPGDDDSVEEWVIERDGALIGFVQFYEEPDEDYRHADVDILLTTRVHEQGLGTDAMRAICRHLIDDRGHHRITL